jgi:acetylornithine/N-succinyldiaminopimelate aminotransferase
VGRTGTLFAFQQYGILPDVASFAKGIAGGLPMSGIMANEKCRGVLGPGTHATTFGANPVCAAAGLVVQETLSDDFLKEVTAKGEYLRKGIEALNLPCFGKTRGLGLMIGIEVKDGYNKSEIANKLIENGLLVLTAGPGMRLLPPLVITKEEMDQGLDIMKKVLS